MLFLTHNIPQSVSKVLVIMFRCFGVTSLTTTAYHLQTNEKVKLYNQTILTSQWQYLSEYQNIWDLFLQSLTFSYNSQVRWSAYTSPFNFVLSRLLLALSLIDTGTSRLAKSKIGIYYKWLCPPARSDARVKRKDARSYLKVTRQIKIKLRPRSTENSKISNGKICIHQWSFINDSIRINQTKYRHNNSTRSSRREP